MGRSILLPVVVSMFVSGAAVAQVERGDIEISFSASLGRNEFDGTSRLSSQTIASDNQDGWSFGGGATAGYFVSDHINVGGSIGFGYFESDSTSQATIDPFPPQTFSSSFESHNYSIGPLFNYHFRPSSKIVPFVGLSGGWSWRESESSSSTGRFDSKNDGWTAEAHGGAHFFFNPHVALKLQLRHSRTETDSESTSQGGGGVSSRTGSETADSTDILVGIAVFLHVNRR